MTYSTDYIRIAAVDVHERYPRIVIGKPKLSDIPAGAIMGTWAISVPNKVRYILAPNLQIVRGVLPGDVTRAWIKDEYDLPIRRRRAQCSFTFSAPTMAQRGQGRDCTYVDIKGAFLHMLYLGYDVEYEPLKYIGATPRMVPAQIRGNKFCYAISVSLSRNPRANIQIKKKDGETFQHHPFNLFSNPCLYNLIMDTLGSVASEMIRVLGSHVHYINTDGYILDTKFVPQAMAIIRSWGFDARIKAQGETVIYGAASWKCGAKHTYRMRPQPRDHISPMPDQELSRWLKARWVRWHERSIEQLEAQATLSDRQGSTLLYDPNESEI